MSDFTPSTEEVRTDYIMAYTERQSSQLLAGLAFDRWHQAELRRAKAEALRYMGRQFEIASEQGTDAVIALLKDQKIIEPQLNNDDYANLKTELEKLR